MAKKWWISNTAFGKQSWTTHSFLKTSVEERGEGKGSNSHFYTKCPPLLKEVWYSTKLTSQKNLNTRMQGDMVKLLNHMQAVKPRCRRSAFSLCKTKVILQQHSAEKNEQCLKNGRKRSITRSITVSCGFFCLVVFWLLLFFYLFKSITISWQWWFGKPFPHLEPCKIHVTNCRAKIRKTMHDLFLVNAYNLLELSFVSHFIFCPSNVLFLS